jgi:hypothetical protein
MQSVESVILQAVGNYGAMAPLTAYMECREALLWSEGSCEPTSYAKRDRDS